MAWHKKAVNEGEGWFGEWSVTTRPVPVPSSSPLTGCLAAGSIQHNLHLPLPPSPQQQLHLFLPRNFDIEQTAVGQSSQTDLLTRQLLRSCNKAITGTHVPIIHAHLNNIINHHWWVWRYIAFFQFRSKTLSMTVFIAGVTNMLCYEEPVQCPWKQINSFLK